MPEAATTEFWKGLKPIEADRRLERSKSRLVAPEFASTSISEIAFVSGFNSSAHFSRAFRARFGCTPRQYRASAGHPG